MIEPLGESSHLNIEDFFTTGLHIVSMGDERIGVNLTNQFKVVRRNQLGCDLPGRGVTLGIDKGRVTPAFGTQHLNINLRHLNLGLQRETFSLNQ